jgi:hypothetical protein
MSDDSPVLLWRNPWGRALLLGIGVGTLGALIGLAIGASRGTAATTSVAWGLYISGALLLFLGSAPAMAPAPPSVVTTMMPDAAREQVMQRQRTRIGGAPWMLLNFLVAVAIIGVGALFEIYG